MGVSCKYTQQLTDLSSAIGALLNVYITMYRNKIFRMWCDMRSRYRVN